MKIASVVGRGTGGREGRRGTSWSQLGWLTPTRSFSSFQRRVELGRGADRDDCQLATATGGSRLGVAGGSVSGVGVVTI